MLLCAALLPFGALSGVISSGSPDELYDLVARSGSCRTYADNEALWRCEYKVGDKLAFSISAEPVGVRNIAFSHSDIRDDLYAVFYDGCIAVVPAAAHPGKYTREYVAYVSPANGRAYRGLAACKDASR